MGKKEDQALDALDNLEAASKARIDAGHGEDDESPEFLAARKQFDDAYSHLSRHERIKFYAKACFLR